MNFLKFIWPILALPRQTRVAMLDRIQQAENIGQALRDELEQLKVYKK